MFTCKICGMQDLPKECMVIDKGTAKCVCCDFEEFLRSGPKLDKVEEIVTKLISDILGQDFDTRTKLN